MTSPFQAERQTLPKLHQVRLVLDKPELPDLARAIAELIANGVPDVAKLQFRQWTMPPSRYYLIASWVEYDDGTIGSTAANSEFG